MSISLFKPIGRFKDIKWLPIVSEPPTNASLVTAALPDDLIITIVEAAARDTATALSLALVSKAVGRMAESVLYNSVILRSLASARAFIFALRIKNRQLLAGVTELVLMTPAPRDFEDFWALVDQRCPRIERLSLSAAADLDVVRPTRTEAHHLFHSFANPPGVRTHDAGESSVPHLYLPNHPTATPPVPQLQPATGLPRLTHFSCFMGIEAIMDPSVYDILRLFLAVPTLRVCVVTSSFQRSDLWRDLFMVRMPKDKRLVVLLADDTDHIGGDGPYWEYAEKTIASRRAA